LAEWSGIYGGCLVPRRISVFSGLKSERSSNGDFGGFSHGDLSPRQAKIRQTVGEKTTHEKCWTFVWRGERSPCENTKKVTIWRVFALRLFAPKTRMRVTGRSLSSVYFNLLQLVFSACKKSHRTTSLCSYFFRSSGIMECTCMLFTFENGVPLVRSGVSVVWLH